MIFLLCGRDLKVGVFQTDRNFVLKYLQNIYTMEELTESATCVKIAPVRLEGKRNVKRAFLHYNLDIIIYTKFYLAEPIR